MTTPAPFDRTLFVTLPVADVAASSTFFTRIGFDLDPRFDDGSGTGACVQVGGQARVMLVDRAKFSELSPRPAADPTTHAIALFCFDVPTREEVDAVAAAAVEAGGVEVDGLEDLGFMCSRSFFDLDGHGWQVMWVDPAAG